MRALEQPLEMRGRIAGIRRQPRQRQRLLRRLDRGQSPPAPRAHRATHRRAGSAGTAASPPPAPPRRWQRSARSRAGDARAGHDGRQYMPVDSTPVTKRPSNARSSRERRRSSRHRGAGRVRSWRRQSWRGLLGWQDNTRRPCAIASRALRSKPTAQTCPLPTLHRSKIAAMRAPVCGVQRISVPHPPRNPSLYEGHEARGEFRRHYGQFARALRVGAL